MEEKAKLVPMGTSFYLTGNQKSEAPALMRLNWP